jgi:uncharacterized protein with GYD domain
MAYFVLLSNFTDQGIRTVKDTQKRANVFKAAAKAKGIKVHHLLWTLGEHDVVAVVEAEDDFAPAALALTMSSLGNVRIRTMRAFDAADMTKVMAKFG